jgi:hypothetical protein
LEHLSATDALRTVLQKHGEVIVWRVSDSEKTKKAKSARLERSRHDGAQSVAIKEKSHLPGGAGG